MTINNITFIFLVFNVLHFVIFSICPVLLRSQTVADTLATLTKKKIAPCFSRTLFFHLLVLKRSFMQIRYFVTSFDPPHIRPLSTFLLRLTFVFF